MKYIKYTIFYVCDAKGQSSREYPLQIWTTIARSNRNWNGIFYSTTHE